LLIAFDLDDTLIDTTGSIMPSRLEKAIGRLMSSGGEFKDSDVALEMLKRLDETALSAKASFSEFLEINDIEPDVASDAKAEIYSTNLTGALVLKRDDVEEVLDQLSHDHQLAIVTAGDRQMQMQKLELAKIPVGLFSTIEICNVGEKESVYRGLIDEYQLDPREIIVCGDRIESDLLPAKRLGMTTVHMRWGRGVNSVDRKEVVDYQIGSVKEIVDIVEHIERCNYLRRI